MSSGAEQVGPGEAARVARRRESLDEQARRRGLKPIRSVDDLVCEGIFDTDEELDEFLAFTYAARRSDMA
jgi:hypothetical protein